jgi:hypothetical protein
MIKLFKKLFCKHEYLPISEKNDHLPFFCNVNKNNYLMLGWYSCKKCGKEKYIGDNVQFTHFKLPTITITKKNHE